MRLLDKILSQGPAHMRTGLRSVADKLTVVTADQIAAHYADSPEMEWPTTMFPYARPPWEFCFVEWRMPETIRMNGEVQPHPRCESGVYCRSQPFTLADKFEFNQKQARIAGEELTTEEAAKIKKAVDEATVMVYAQPATFIAGRLVVPAAMGIWLLNDEGTVLHWCMEGDQRVHMLAVLADQHGTSFGAEWFHIAWLTFTFANVRNTRLIDVTEEIAPVPKIRRRLRIPEVKRYTLEIGGVCIRPTRSYDDAPATTGVMPYHLCRGHFATYTAAKPLFGNAKLVGRFWHPPHTRGKKENGEIIKDYTVLHNAGQSQQATENVPVGRAG